MMATVSNEQRAKLHPHKFTLLVAMGSIVMMFAGFTSAYVVKSNQANWLQFSMPPTFWYSTAVILISSATIVLATKAFKAREMARYRLLITITAALGVAFIVLQWMGFSYLDEHGVKLFGTGSNAAGSFIGVITGVHMLHVLGGVIALLVMFANAYSRRRKNYSSTAIEMAGIYWHFVDFLWIYLFIFYQYVSG
jgi:cytochrome c oxidase subunit III